MTQPDYLKRDCTRFERDTESARGCRRRKRDFWHSPFWSSWGNTIVIWQVDAYAGRRPRHSAPLRRCQLRLYSWDSGTFAMLLERLSPKDDWKWNETVRESWPWSRPHLSLVFVPFCARFFIDEFTSKGRLRLARSFNGKVPFVSFPIAKASRNICELLNAVVWIYFRVATKTSRWLFSVSHLNCRAHVNSALWADVVFDRIRQECDPDAFRVSTLSEGERDHASSTTSNSAESAALTTCDHEVADSSQLCYVTKNFSLSRGLIFIVVKHLLIFSRYFMSPTA